MRNCDCADRAKPCRERAGTGAETVPCHFPLRGSGTRHGRHAHRADHVLAARFSREALLRNSARERRCLVNKRTPWRGTETKLVAIEGTGVGCRTSRRPTRDLGSPHTASAAGLQIHRPSTVEPCAVVRQQQPSPHRRCR